MSLKDIEGYMSVREEYTNTSNIDYILVLEYTQFL